MQIEIYREATVFDTLRSEWNALLEHSVSRIPFLRAEYQQAWWRHRGGGEWETAELVVVVARDEAGQVVGVAPLFYTPRNRDGRPALMFIGSVEISDYLDLLVGSDQLNAFCDALLTRLSQADLPAWEVLDLYNLQAVSPTRAALEQAARSRGWQTSESVLEPVPEIQLPGDWETYLGMMEKKERQELKRKLRRATGGDDQISWYVVDATRDLAAEIDAFLRLMVMNEDKARFLKPEMRAQFIETMQAAFAGGWLHLAFLEVAGDKAAAYFSFDFDNRLWVYNSALNPRYAALSAGWILLGYLLQWAIEHRRATFDFMRGGEDYKYRFGAVAGKIYRWQGGERLKAASPADN